MATPGALKTLGANKDAPLPIRLFEVSDVILLDPAAETGARNEQRLVAVACGKDDGFQVIHGFLNRIMEALGVPLLGIALALQWLIDHILQMMQSGIPAHICKCQSYARAVLMLPSSLAWGHMNTLLQSLFGQCSGLCPVMEMFVAMWRICNIRLRG